MRSIEWDELAVQCVRAGLSLGQMMNYTPHELKIVMDGIFQREQDKLQVEAWKIANIINYTGRTKKLVKPEDLIRINKQQKQVDVQSEWQRLIKEVQ